MPWLRPATFDGLAQPPRGSHKEKSFPRPLVSVIHRWVLLDNGLHRHKQTDNCTPRERRQRRYDERRYASGRPLRGKPGVAGMGAIQAIHANLCCKLLSHPVRRQRMPRMVPKTLTSREFESPTACPPGMVARVSSTPSFWFVCPAKSESHQSGRASEPHLSSARAGINPASSSFLILLAPLKRSKDRGKAPQNRRKN